MSLRHLIESNKKHLEYMRSTNEKYERIKSQCDEVYRQTLFSRRAVNSAKILETIIKNCKSAYSQHIISSITSTLTNCLDIILQDKNYEVDLEIYQFRGKTHLRSWLIDETGAKLPPNIVEGDMLNQVLSFCASVILTRLQGYSWVFYDEAFASANSRSIILIRMLLKSFLEEGFNFVFVSQNPLLFTEFDKNLIELIQEDGCVSSVVQSYIPASTDESIDERALELYDFLLRG